MARIYGTIESLKSLKSELEDQGITRFNSVKEINYFLKNYNSEKLAILDDISVELDKEYIETSTRLNKRLQRKAEIINLQTEKINNRITNLRSKIANIKGSNPNLVLKLISIIRICFAQKKINHFIKNKPKIINSSVKHISRNIENDKLFIGEYDKDKQSLIDKRAKYKLEKLENTRNVVENTRNLISGAIGESLVVKEIEKLSDDFVLINNFNLTFSRPIFYKKQNHRIYSIQIDHLLISKAGIFIIETKNWSKSSVNSLSLRSPIQQIERSNFALYVYLSENIALNGHHWGEQQIPIRNLIVMINNKPKTNFKYVKIKLLREMNSYIKYFEPVLTENQLDKILNNLF